MTKEDLIIKLVDFDFEFIEMMRDSKYCRFLCNDSYNKHQGRLMIIAGERRTIMEKLDKMNAIKTFSTDFEVIKKKIIIHRNKKRDRIIHVMNNSKMNIKIVKKLSKAIEL